MDERLREFVRNRAADRCEYCRIPQEALRFARFHIEHIRARQHGGTDEPENLALACRRCNLFKGPNLTSIDPQTGQLAPLFNPRVHHWEDHFATVGAVIAGMTAIGRATVALLNMNEEERLIVREERRAEELK